MPVLSRDSDALIACAVDMPKRRAEEQRYEPLAKSTGLFGSETQLKKEKSVVGRHTIQYGATQAYQLGRSAGTILRDLLECKDKQELFGGAQAKQTTLTRQAICLHVLPWSVGMKVVSLSREVPSTPLAGERPWQ